VGEYRLDRFTVLLVEDNGFISQTLETLLRQLKIARLTTAKNGEEAIEWLKLQKKIIIRVRTLLYLIC
jgi:CheY-like chemotaxis protein